MTLRFVPHAERWREAVRALNARMARGGGPGFFVDPVPAWLPPAPGRTMYREYVLAVDGTQARGGYVLKHEPALLGGRPETVASVQGPYSEGAVDPRHAGVVFAMVRDMLERRPLLYGWGLERREDSVLPLFRALGWRSHATPVLAWAPGRARRTGPGPAAAERVTAEPATADALGRVADELWERCAYRYAFAVRRDGHTLADLYPAANPRFRRLVVRGPAGRPAGWAVVGVRTLRGDPRVGTARVGVLWDFFGAPEDSSLVLAAARDHLASLGAELVVASAAHDAWIAALRGCGFTDRPERRHLLVSRPLAAAVGFDRRAGACFLTFGDGENHLGRLGTAVFGPPAPARGPSG
jgi:hypothetical protein